MAPVLDDDKLLSCGECCIAGLLMSDVTADCAAPACMLLFVVNSTAVTLSHLLPMTRSFLQVHCDWSVCRHRDRHRLLVVVPVVLKRTPNVLVSSHTLPEV